MTITGIGTSYGGSSVADATTSSTGSTEKMGMDQFLTLFVAQLQHQDPLNPMDSAQFTGQLAQFASVEQLYGMNAKLGDIQGTLSSQDQKQDLVGLIGKTVKADDNTILVENGKVLSGSYEMENNGDAVVAVYDGAGEQVRTLYCGQLGKGEHNITWDGRDDNGNRVADGTYTFKVVARNQDGSYVEAKTYASGEVTGITYKQGQPYLMIGDRLINSDTSKIVEISKTGTEQN